MDDGKLLFLHPADGTGRLVFGDTGDDGGSTAPPAEFALDADLPGLGTLGLAYGTTITVDAALDAAEFTGTITLEWDANVSRGARIELASHWQKGVPTAMGLGTAWQQAENLRTGTGAHWQQAQQRNAALDPHWQEAERLRKTIASHWQEADKRRAVLHARWEEAERLRLAIASAWQQAETRRGELRAHWQETVRLRAAVRGHWQPGTPLRATATNTWGAGIPVRVRMEPHWQEAWRPRAGVTKRPTPPVRPPCYDPATIGKLVFTEPLLPGDGKLLFICDRGDDGPPQPGATVVVPIRRVYMVLNSASLRRVDGGISLPTFDMSLSLDVGSWTWGFSASLPLSALPDLQPSGFGDPVILEAVVNGEPYRFLAETIASEREFGSERLRVTGRGLSATLDAPYAPVLNFNNNTARTAQQLMLEALTFNGVPLDWSVDWQMTDWLVPGGVWSHQGSYISALNTIAGAAGGYVQPHASDKTLHIARLYPTAPWDWGTTTPDYELPSAVVLQETISWKENARYNRVFVSGMAGGRLGQVTRAGTAGDLNAPPVVDALVTHADAARQRGISVLATGGRQAMVGLIMPVLPETGVIVPGKMVRYVDGATTRIGITRAVEVSVGMPEITQRLEVETYA